MPNINQLGQMVADDAALISKDDPTIGILSILGRMNPGRTAELTASPFTQKLLQGLGRGNALQNLMEMTSDGSAFGTGAQGLQDFTQNLLSSIYDPTQANPLGDYSLGSFQDVGRLVSDLLSGTGQAASSLVGQGIKGMTPDQVVGYLTSAINTFGTFSMSDLQRTLITNGLMMQQANYINHLRDNGLQSNQFTFAEYLIKEAADWLYKWWRQSEPSTGGGVNTGI